MTALYMHLRLPRQAGKSSRVYRSNGNLSISREMHMKDQLVHKQRDERNTKNMFQLDQAVYMHGRFFGQYQRWSIFG